MKLRSEVEHAHQQLLTHWAAPGHSWTGAERLAMVEQVRAARAADVLQPWLSATEAGVAASETLPDIVVDALWRITQNVGSLSETWFRSVIDAGVSEVAYVEMLSVAATANMLETFAHASGVPSPSLPSPTSPSSAPLTVESDGGTSEAAVLASGESAAVVSTHWVPTVDSPMPNVRKALSAVPAELAMQGALLDAHYVPGGALGRDLGEMVWSLDRTQMELIATRTSTMNECFY